MKLRSRDFSRFPAVGDFTREGRTRRRRRRASPDYVKSADGGKKEHFDAPHPSTSRHPLYHGNPLSTTTLPRMGKTAHILPPGRLRPQPERSASSRRQPGRRGRGRTSGRHIRHQKMRDKLLRPPRAQISPLEETRVPRVVDWNCCGVVLRRLGCLIGPRRPPIPLGVGFFVRGHM